MIHYPFIGALPLIITVLLTVKIKDAEKSMVFGAAFALLLRLFTILTPAPVQGPAEGLAFFLKETFFTLYGIILGKAGILISVFMLLSLVVLICESGVIDLVEKKVSRIADRGSLFTALFIFMCLVFSIDDYLVCVALPAAAGAASKRLKIRKETMVYMTSLLSITFCILLPISSWGPFVNSTVRSSLNIQMAESFKTICAQARVMNLAVLSVPVLGASMLLSEVSPHAEHRLKREQAERLPSSESLKPLALTGAAMSLVMLLMMCFTDGDYTVAAGGAAGLAALSALLLSSGQIRPALISKALKEGLAKTQGLARTLLSIWILTSVCTQSLSLSSDVGKYMTRFSGADRLIPGELYVASGLFAFITGSAFAAIAVFVPLAFVLVKSSAPVFLTAAAVSAALAGSMQAGNSVTSDTVRLAQDSFHADDAKVRALQFRMAILQGSVYTAGYLFAGLLSGRGPAAMTLIPALCICFIYIFLPGRRKEAGRSGSSVKICMARPYPVKIYTFHMGEVIAEQIYMARLLSLIAHSLNRIRSISVKREISDRQSLMP